MSGAATETRSVVVEREFPHPPEKIWRALTQPHLLEAWLMKTDFQPDVGRGFGFRADWGAVEGRVLEAEPNRVLSYTWDAMGLESVVTWTLTPTQSGTLLRMEQAGFQRDQKHAYGGALVGWPKFFANLEQVLSGLD